MKDQLISVESVKLLVQGGFDENFKNPSVDGGVAGLIAHPTQSLVAAWLRSRGVQVWVAYKYDERYPYEMNIRTTKGVGLGEIYPTYEEALEAGITLGLRSLL